MISLQLMQCSSGCSLYFKNFIFLQHRSGKLTHGVIGNTSDFGSEESRFETWWVNKMSPFGFAQGGIFCFEQVRGRRGEREIYILWFIYHFSRHPAINYYILSINEIILRQEDTGFCYVGRHANSTCGSSCNKHL